MENDSISVPAGKIKCFITGQLRPDMPEERVRQDIAKSLVDEYGYDKKDMEPEFKIHMGRMKKKPDICIFLKGKTHEQKNIYLVCEVKREDIKASDRKEGIGQFESYLAASPNAKFGLWVGEERIAVEVIEKRGERICNPIPDIPKFGETKSPKPTRGRLVPAVTLSKVFKRIHNYIHVNQGFQKDKAFEELLKIIFIKVYDEQYSHALQFYFLAEENIDDVRERLNGLFSKVKSRYKYIFKGNETIELNDNVLGYIVSELQRFSLVDTETDVKGEAYEELVGPNLRGNQGEYFTPRSICNMTVKMCFDLLGEDKIANPGAIKVLDPAAGTGGFLISAVQYLKCLFSQRGARYDKLRDLVREVAESNFFGIDFNPFLVKVSQMNMVMHGDGSANIEHVNSLENCSNWSREARDKIKLENFDIVITNPPFGADLQIDDPDILSQYKLTTYGSTNPRSSLPPEQLFIERCMHFLKPDGILGIVVPDSILSNPGLLWIRNWINDNAFLIASIDLPMETFEKNKGVPNASVIILKKKDKNKKEPKDYEVFMAIPQKIGYDRRGNPIYKTNPDGEIELNKIGMPIIDDQIPHVSEIFNKWIKEKGIV